MDQENYANIIALDTEEQYHDKVKYFTSYCTQPEHQIPSVPDPYYGANDGFELVANMLEDGCTELLRQIQTEIF